jgi:hypothetical protein
MTPPQLPKILEFIEVLGFRSLGFLVAVVNGDHQWRHSFVNRTLWRVLKMSGHKDVVAGVLWLCGAFPVALPYRL